MARPPLTTLGTRRTMPMSDFDIVGVSAVGRDPLRTELLKGAMAYLVLAVLREGEQYGYQVAAHIRERSDGAFAPSEGSLYPTLHRLEADGKLRAAWERTQSGSLRRRYSVTRRP